MKKILSTLLFAILFISVLTGCKQDNSASLIAKNLDENLNKLSVAVNKLDSVDNKYLSNPDIYSSLSATTNHDNNKYFALAFNEVEATQISNESVKQVLIDKITDKLLSQNTDCSNQSSYTCKKYCDDNGNCYYTDCNGNSYCYSTNGDCYTCDSIPNNCQYMGQRNISCPSANTINDLESTDLKVEQISTTTDTLNENKSNEIIDDNTILNDTDTIINSDNSESNNNENDNELNTPNPRVKMFYFSQDSFAPIKLKYNPRYISQYNESTINEQIENYLYKVQKLYAMSEDSIEANNILQNCKQNIIDCINEIRELNSCIINGECEPTIQELQALNNYIVDIKTTTKRLKDCNGELNREINKISETNSNVMINSVDVMNSNYMRLLNHIDTRVTYHKSAIATLEQIKYLLDNAINGNEITDEEIEEIIESFTTQEEIIEDNDIINDDTQDTLNDQDTTTDTGETVSDKVDNIDETLNNDKIFIDDSESDSVTTDIEEDKTTNNSLQNNIEINNPDNNSAETAVENDNEENTIIDTYNKTNGWSNIDTYKNNDTSDNTEVDVNNDSIQNNSEDSDSNVIIDNNPSSDATNTESENIENSTIDTTSNDSNEIMNNVDENIVNDSTIVDSNANNDVIIDNSMTNTTNSGIYKNSVITQNNLNNDNGYGGYYYTADGEIKNNGINNNNEFGNNGNTIENNTNKANNVNTYGYNTLLDIINQGTVNNGINTL